MSRKRQAPIFVSRGETAWELTTLTWDYRPFQHVPDHVHPEGQLVFASRGVMTVRVGTRAWIVPPQKAVWIPPREVHSIDMSKAVSMRTLYLEPKTARLLAKTCRVLHVSPFLRELILHCCDRGKLSVKDKKQHALIQVVLSQIEEAQTMPMSLPLPADPRAAKITDTLLADPEDQRTLDELCNRVGASKRTIERIFAAETGLTFGKWRRQMRLLHAIKLISEGEKITEAALAAGYNSPSAFISMFRRVLGVSPSQFS